MFIEWQWLTGDHSPGHSEWIEVWPAPTNPRTDGAVPPGASGHSKVKLTVTVMMTGTATPFRSVGSIFDLRTASSAA